jgi:penicillin amidase
MKFLRIIFSFAFTFLLLWILDTRPSEHPFLSGIKALERAPAFGHFLNPYGGFWQNAEPKKINPDLRIKSERVKDKIEIAFDERLIPHIFAKNDYDLYYAQGYVTAKYRLWQMDFITRAAAGRLSEFLGEQLFEFDKLQRRIGMLFAAEEAIKAMDSDTLSRMVMLAYADGVNDYIEQLSPKDLPIEYKLLGYQPEKWSPLKSALLQKYMAQDLSYRGDDLQMTNILNRYGKEIIKELFSGYPPEQDPIIPPQTNFDFKKLTIPKAPKEYTAPLPLMEQPAESVEKAENKKGIGSNNWAIGGEKTASGYPILANDPHLGLNLPSIWFELQLVSPKVNVYGAALPGAPGVVIGFNQEISWGVTNVESDVQDWYLIKFKDDSKKEYWHDKQWKPTKYRIEEIKVKGKASIKDTIYFTHHGPIVAYANEKEFGKKNQVPLNCALRWIAHDQSNDLMTFYRLNRARNYDDYRKAIANYTCPAQNFVFADVHKDIAITPNGKFPLKWKEQGKFVLDGTNPTHDWQDWIPANQNPHTKNPVRGFVSSANQFPADTTYPYYLHWEFATFERGKRVNERLSVMQKATMDSLQDIQNDNLNIFARNLVPAMISRVKTDELSADEKAVLQELSRWDYKHEKEKIGASIYKEWWPKIFEKIWQDDFGDDKYGMRFPAADRTREMILHFDSTKHTKWFDDRSTPTTETIQQILTLTFKETVKSLTDKFGKMGEKWQWKTYRVLNIRHLGRIEQFSSLNVVSNGDPRCVNAVGNTNGPSWRMVVQLGLNPKARCIYPGGQSGNPGSHFYSNFIDVWAKGELAEIKFLKNFQELKKPLTILRISK